MSAPAQPGRSFGRVVGASIIGTTVEWYDFFLYGSAAALVFTEAVLPRPVGPARRARCWPSAPTRSGFAARPLGGLVFGHFGDRLGPQETTPHRHHEA